MGKLKSNKEYSDYWVNLSTDERLKLSNEIQNKWKYYRSLGYEVSTFLSGTFIYDSEDNEIFSSKVPIVHFLKSIDVMDEYLNNNNYEKQ